MAAEFLEDGLATTATGSSVAEIRAYVISTFQFATADSRTEVLRFEVILDCIADVSLPCSRAAPFTTFMATAAHLRSTFSIALRTVLASFMTDELCFRFSASARDI